jgi:hypothetical protein
MKSRKPKRASGAPAGDRRRARNTQDNRQRPEGFEGFVPVYDKNAGLWFCSKSYFDELVREGKLDPGSAMQ